ncbi:glycosyltransferase family 2 protein [Oleiagrimonas sp. MCCC 1A03011]|uniref:glycosyltransferase family 2 protein n=1 Tax=Oleiagrimonas sp. MCCC 1A03011 TaxID=1926883 RepID=UPI000DC56AC8|nr:glycosyltransferase family 2 protein [Oleiagrimonas sp. MCCC 1A03011]RAP58436.1 hypothetical protein BTJ49_05690 [Oleiagrimonas sp. MCCC 1A03011]
MTGLSIVVPVYKSGPGLRELHTRIVAALDSLTADWELILIDDASNDGTFSKMQDLRNLDPRVKTIRFAKNMGQHHATLCGLQKSKGNVVVTIDDDLQHRPEDIPKLLHKLEEGFDLVIGKISNTKKHHGLRNFGSRLVQKMTERVVGKPPHLGLTSFRAMSRRAADSIATYRGTQTYLPALMFGSVPPDLIANVDIEHAERAYGSSNYTPAKLIGLASFLLINHSYIPLRAVTAWGIMLSIASFLYALWILAHALIFGSSAIGWPSLAVLVAFLSGNILLCMGILGEYIGRLVEESAHSRQFPILEDES